ncbi:hypothetical protein [Sabulibacter ruber]|uniref:hypothetical protein n=1 Tax=Sabulibacter ruber TaxID=2811901 RepID=UPI001A9697DC|nr:hypothetical protein [Sabulibacter ruber]
MNIQEAVNNLNNTDLIKLIGILVTIIIAFFGFIGRAIFTKWKHSLDLEIKLLDSKNSQNERLLSSFSSTSNISQTKRIEAIEEFWAHVLDIKKCIPSAGHLAYSILSQNELDDFFNLQGDLPKLFLQQVPNKESEEIFWELCGKCERLRPFLGEALWLNFQMLQGFVGRTRFIFKESVNKKSLTFWQDDDFFARIFLALFTEDENKLINSNRYSSYQYALEVLEQRLLTEVNDILSGKRLTYDSVTMAKKLIHLKSDYKA